MPNRRRRSASAQVAAEFPKGTVVLAKYRNYPHWPAKITSIGAEAACVKWLSGAGTTEKSSVFRIKWKDIKPYVTPQSDDPALNTACRRAERIIAEAQVNGSSPSTHRSEGGEGGEAERPSPPLSQHPSNASSQSQASSSSRTCPSKSLLHLSAKAGSAPFPSAFRTPIIPPPTPSPAKEMVPYPSPLIMPKPPPPPPFRRGDLVWAKVQRYPEFPCLVLGPHRDGQFTVAFLPLPQPLPLQPDALDKLEKFKASPAMMRRLDEVGIVAEASEELASALEQAEAILEGAVEALAPNARLRSPRKDRSPSPKRPRLSAPTNANIIVVNIGDPEDEADKGGEEEMEKEKDEPSDLGHRLTGRILSEDGRAFFRALQKGEVGWSARAELWRSLPDGDPMPTPPSFGPIVAESHIESIIEALTTQMAAELQPDTSLQNAYVYVVTVGLPECVRWALAMEEGLDSEATEKALASAKPLFRAPRHPTPAPPPPLPPSLPLHPTPTLINSQP